MRDFWRRGYPPLINPPGMSTSLLKNNTRNNERYYAIWTRDPGEGHKRHKEIRNNVYVASGRCRIR